MSRQCVYLLLASLALTTAAPAKDSDPDSKNDDGDAETATGYTMTSERRAASSAFSAVVVL